MKRLLLSLALVGALAAPASAQTPAGPGVNFVPQTGVSTAYISRATYSAVFIGLAPAATTTDLLCIAGSATKTIRLQSIKISGSAGTTLSLPVTVLRRISVDTGGTAASTTANPANTISKRDTTNGAATATLIGYTANPTITDTSPTYIDSAQLAVSLTTMATTGNTVEFNWARDTENFLQPPVLVGTAAQICVNLNSTSLSSGLLTGSINWTEE